MEQQLNRNGFGQENMTIALHNAVIWQHKRKNNNNIVEKLDGLKPFRKAIETIFAKHCAS